MIPFNKLSRNVRAFSSITFTRWCIYISLLFLIIFLIYVKHQIEVSRRVGRISFRNVIEEKFASNNTAVQLEATSGSDIVIKANGVNLLDYTTKNNNSMYLVLLKDDGTPRIIKPYNTGINPKESDLLLEDLQEYFNVSQLISDKYLALVSHGTASVNFKDNLKDYIKTTFGASKITDYNNSKPYILVIDLIKNSKRIEVLGDNGSKVSINELLFSEERQLTYNSDGLLISGLQCYLDATRKESYNESFGNLWKDISGKNRHFTWKNKPLVSDGKMLNTIKYGGSAIGPSANSFELGNGSNGFTIVLYSKTNTLQYSHAFYFENNVGNPVKYGIQAHIPWPDSKVYFDQGWDTRGEKLNNSDNRVSTQNNDWNEYHTWIFMRSYDNTLKIYKDGVLINSNENKKLANLDLTNVPVVLGLNNWDANISKFLVYNTYFLDNEVKNLSDWILNDEKKQRELRIKATEAIVPNTTKIPVKLGLQLYLDAKNYKEGSLEWKDLSGNNYDFIWDKSPSIESNSIVLKGEYALSKKPSALLNIDGKDTYTICWTSKTNSLSQNNVFKIMGNDAFQSRGIFVHPTWTNNRIYFDQGGCCDGKIQRLDGDVSRFSKDYAFYCIRKTNTSRSIFINGKELYSENTSGKSININTEPMIIGRDLQNNFTWFANLRNFMVYNRDLSNTEIEKLSNRFYSKYEFGNYSYDDAAKFCRKQGMSLCSSSDICKNNQPLYLLDDNTWSPIGDYPNGWIQVGKNGETCKTYQQHCSISKDATCDPEGNPDWGNKGDREVAMLCCDVKYIPLLINAIFMTPNQATFFRDSSYQTITLNSKTGNIEEIMNVENIDKFKGLTTNFASGNIDSITITNDVNKSLWCKGKYIMVYDNINQKGTETLFSEYFNELSDDFINGNIDGIGSKGPNKEYILFKKTKYCIVDMNTKTRIKEGFIRDFSNLPSDFKLGFLDCVVYSGREGCNYLLKNDKLIEYNFNRNEVIKGPIDIINEFPYLLPPFSAKNRECGVLENIIKIYGDRKSIYDWSKKYYKVCKRVIKKEYDINLETYKKLVDKYNSDYTKEKQNNEAIIKQIEDFEKKLEQKRKELKDFENRMIDIRVKPCKKNDICSDKKVKPSVCKDDSPFIPSNIINRKQIVVLEKDKKSRKNKFYEINPNKVNNCLYDPNVGQEFKDGFNFFEHPKFKDYVESTKLKSITDFNIKDHPDYTKYIPKNKVPVQKSAKDFDITKHPDYYKYEPI